MLALRFPGWEAAFSERADGDLRVRSRASAEPVAEVQARILEALSIGGVAVGRQVHGVDVVAVSEPVEGYLVGLAQGDAVVTALTDVAVAVHVADCLPIAVGGEGAVAMLHGGWRGLAGGIVERGVAALHALGVEGPLAAAIGPGVGGCCYETGDEVREHFPGHSHGRLLDLKAVAAAQLRDAGVGVVEDVGLCTICSTAGRLFSRRRDGLAYGCQGGFAWRT